MRLSRVFKWWFGYLAVDAAATVWADRTAASGTRDHIHGYHINHVKDLIDRWYRARPDIEKMCAGLDDDTRNSFLTGLLQLSPSRWKAEFGFEKPAPDLR